MKNKRIHLLCIAIAAVLIFGSYGAAHAGQYDVAYPIVTSTSAGASVTVTAPGSNGAVQTIATTATNGVVQTTGSGLTVNAGPQLTGSAAVAAVSGTNALPAGILALSSSNSVVISTGTGQGFRAAP